MTGTWIDLPAIVIEQSSRSSWSSHQGRRRLQCLHGGGQLAIVFFVIVVGAFYVTRRTGTRSHRTP